MIWIPALEKSGLSNKVLKRILTTKAPEPTAQKTKGKKQRVEDGHAPATDDPVGALYRLETLPKNPTDWDIRCFLHTLVQGQFLEGMARCTAKFDKYAAMDLAYTSIPIHPLLPDLMKVAQGYLSLETCSKNIAAISTGLHDKLFEKDAKGKVQSLNTPKLLEVSHNLVNSLVTRRVAALATEIAQQYPTLKYDPYSNNRTERFRADVNTQLAEQMAGAYGYREQYEQSIRDASLYTSSFKFKTKAWHVERQTLPDYQPSNGASATGREEEPKLKRQVVREGVEFIIPHPSRVYYDISKPLSKLNQDIGPRWIGYWDVVPIGQIRDDPAYFNTESLAMDAQMFSLYATQPAYFAQYYGASDMCFPNGLEEAMKMTADKCRGSVPASVLALKNDRTANVGQWAQLYRNVATVLTEHYIKLIPKQVGLGTYEDPVWVRFVMAANTTIVYAEIVGSAPASVNSYNASDHYLIDQSFGMQALQWQQMLTNSLNQLVHVQAQGTVKLWALNKHGMSKDDAELAVNMLKNPDFSNLKNIVIEYDAELLQHRGQDPGTITEKITQVKVETAAKTNEIFNDITNTLALAERLMFFSPQELGQVAARTTTATEQRAIRDTTLGIRDFHLVGVKRQMDADKRIIHSSYVAFGSDDLEVPVAERYPKEVVEAAGFEIVADGSGGNPDGLYTIRGKKLGLLYNYTYTTRNTDDTPPEAAQIQGLAQVFEIATTSDRVRGMITNGEVVELFNRLTDAILPGFPRINLPADADPNGTEATTIQQMQQQFQQMLPQLGQGLQQLQQKQAEQDQKIAQTQAGQVQLAQALARLTAATEKLAGAAAGPRRPRADNRPTRQGQISPDMPIGAGAPPLRGAAQPQVVPALV